MFNKLIVYLKNVKVILLNEIDTLSKIFDFNSEPKYIEKSKIYGTIDVIIKQCNYYDCKLYDIYSLTLFTFKMPLVKIFNNNI